MKPTSNPALERDALYAKSQVYIRRGFRAHAEKDTEEYQLWAALALELLGKAALAQVHPALVADPDHFQSLFAACGHQISPNLRTITASTLFKRLTHIDKAFDSRHMEACEQMALRRNAELHSGESPFSGMSPEAWEQEFWGAAEIILGMQDESLESWLGAEDAKAPAQIIQQAQHALEGAVGNRVSRCKQDFEREHKNAKHRHKIAVASRFLTWNDRTWDTFERCTCSACRCLGFLGGNLWSEEVIGNESEGSEEFPPMETVRKTFVSELFYCPTCKLRLFGTKEISAADLPAEFYQTEDRLRLFEPEYGND